MIELIRYLKMYEAKPYTYFKVENQDENLPLENLDDILDAYLKETQKMSTQYIEKIENYGNFKKVFLSKQKDFAILEFYSYFADYDRIKKARDYATQFLKKHGCVVKEYDYEGLLRTTAIIPR